MADLLRDERVQAAIHELALVAGGGETEHQAEPECLGEPEPEPNVVV